MLNTLNDEEKKMQPNSKQVLPFLKWAGGKRWLTCNHSSLFPQKFNRYLEPFLGSGAVFFSLRPESAILSDLNKDLIETYMTLKTRWRAVSDLLEQHQQLHSKKHYYEVRESSPNRATERAARFIYLNRTCWNGLYRVNRHGRFNVPKGTKNEVVLDTDDFSITSSILKSAELTNCDFEVTVNRARKGDLLFVDPPYTVKHNNNGFIKYNENLFSWEDQERLAESLIKATRRGSKIVATNANHISVRRLYRGSFDLRVVTRASVLAGDPKHRKLSEELIITSL